VTDLYVPIADGREDRCYISKSYDATSHFETTTDDVKDIYERITGKPLIVKEKLRPTQVYPLATSLMRRRRNRLPLLPENFESIPSACAAFV
jgi:GDP dissociation inhibitor